MSFGVDRPLYVRLEAARPECGESGADVMVGLDSEKKGSETTSPPEKIPEKQEKGLDPGRPFATLQEVPLTSSAEGSGHRYGGAGNQAAALFDDPRRRA